MLQQLGFTNVKVYDSSWLGYGNTLDAPAENVTFFNIGLLNSRLSVLQERVNQLEKELADVKARAHCRARVRAEAGERTHRVGFPRCGTNAASA